MSDDRTVDADEATMDELRRLAAEARAAQSTSDATVHADDSTMAELRRFAEEAKRQSSTPPSNDHPADRTVDADGSTMDTLRAYAEEARRATSGAADPTIDPRPGAPIHADRDAPSIRPAPIPPIPTDASPAVRATPLDLPPAIPDDATLARREADRPNPVEIRPAADHPGEVWRPPPRMVMPTEPEKHTPVHHGPWRTISIVLAGLVAALLAFVAFTVVSGGEDEVPADGTVPGATVDDSTGEGAARGG